MFSAKIISQRNAIKAFVYRFIWFRYAKYRSDVYFNFSPVGRQCPRIRCSLGLFTLALCNTIEHVNITGQPKMTSNPCPNKNNLLHKGNPASYRRMNFV